MERYHAIYGIKLNNETKLSYTTINGWPNLTGKKIIDTIRNYSTEEMKNWFEVTTVSETKNETELMNSLKTLHSPKNDKYVYKYIINLDNDSLDFYCHNTIPRARISFETIRNSKTENIINSMQILDKETNYMYNLFDLTA